METGQLRMSAAEISANLEQLKKYLQDICALESACYRMGKIDVQINGAINCLNKPYPAAPVYEKEPFFTKLCFAVISCVIGAVLGLLISLLISAVTRSTEFTYVLEHMALIGGVAIGALIGIKNFLIQDTDAKKQHMVQYAEWEKGRRSFEQEKTRVPLLEKQRAENRATWTQSSELLKQIYEINVILPEYRNLMAVTQIYEYLYTGRCNELTGVNGAYNLYEWEVQHNIIKANVEQVSQRMNEVAESQAMLCQLIRDTNSVLADVRTEVGFITHNTGVITMSAALQRAYYC